MNKILVLILLLCSFQLWAKQIIIAPGTASPSGNDNNAGTLAAPYLTLTKAWSVVAAGDTIYIRGGTYAMASQTSLINKSGTEDRVIKIINYPNESPVFDFSTTTFMTNTTGIHIRNTGYLYLKGFRITGLVQRVGGASHYGIRFYDNVNYTTLKNIECDHIGGTGFVVGGSSGNNLFEDCDSHHNSDQYSISDPWGSGDGFQSAATGNDNTFIRCRAWWNSDDGFDFRLVNGLVTLESCWAFNNGYIPETTATGGNGEGFKLGPKGKAPSTTDTLRVVFNCLAFNNRLSGFAGLTAGYYTMYIIMYNNIAYSNGVGVRGNGFRFVDAGMVTTLKNNLDYRNGATPALSHPNTHTNNSWDSSPEVTVSNADFRSIDPGEMSGARQADGSLPVTTFLHLARKSDLINAGIDVGLPYENTAPDIGAYEYVFDNPPGLLK